jgi:hypothetical protein
MKTNRTLKLITLTAAIFGFAATSFGQNSADATAAAGAKIIAPITINKDIDLYFGNIVKTEGANVVTLAANASGDRIATISTSLMTSQTGSPTAAKFSVGGETAFSYAVELPDSITLDGDGDDMTVDTFTTDLTSDKGIIGTNDAFYVGAKLHVNADQGVGLYTGEFQVTVAYE